MPQILRFPRPWPNDYLVISGFNTDVECDGTVYHVQTEDRGRSACVIISLVYEKGTIIASKRVSYEDLAESGEIDERVLAARVSRQHRLICAAVRAGRIEELKKMATKKAFDDAKPQPVSVVVNTDASPAITNNVEPENLLDLNGDLPIIDDAEIIVEPEILPPEAVTVVSELSGRERRSHNRLIIELIGDPKFKGGDRRTITLLVCRGTENKVVANAQIMVKVLGSSFRPLIFHANTDNNGLANVHLQLPKFNSGRAALLLRAISDGEEVELRRIITPG